MEPWEKSFLVPRGPLNFYEDFACLDFTRAYFFFCRSLAKYKENHHVLGGTGKHMSGKLSIIGRRQFVWTPILDTPFLDAYI